MSDDVTDRPDALPDPLLGRRIGSYVVEERLGSGGMGAVYIAVQPALGKRVAIKFLAAHLSGEPTEVQRFFAEARSVNMIQHENIVDIFDFGRTADGYSYFVMELLSGVSLGAILRKDGCIPVGRTLRITRQVASALAATHAHGIIHRDIKPDNILLIQRTGSSDFVKVLDFGIAKLSEGTRRTVSGMVLGTPGFMSPEQTQASPLDGRLDIYALGVLMYLMIVGEIPFDGPNLVSILQKQAAGPAPSLVSKVPDIDRALSELVASMIAYDPESRPATMAEVLEHPGLRAGPEDAALHSRREIPTPRAKKSSRSLPIPWIVAGLSLIGGPVLGWLTYQMIATRSQPPPPVVAPALVEPRPLLPPPAPSPATAPTPAEEPRPVIATKVRASKPKPHVSAKPKPPKEAPAARIRLDD